MTALAFDTHQFVKELTFAGFTEAQAEAMTSFVKRTRAQELDELASKAELAQSAQVTATKSDVTDLKVAIAESKAEILKWMFGTVGFQTLVILGGVLALTKLPV